MSGSLVYVSGPLVQDSSGWMSLVATALSRAGLTPLVPDRAIRRGGIDAFRGQLKSRSRDVIVGRDMSDIRRCDAVLARVWPVSAGTSMEIFYAHQQGKLVVGWNDDGKVLISAWIHYFCHAVFHALGPAVDFLAQELVDGWGG